MGDCLGTRALYCPVKSLLECDVIRYIWNDILFHFRWDGAKFIESYLEHSTIQHGSSVKVCPFSLHVDGNF